MTTTDGAPPLPLTFGERDVVQARWSPDGERIAYVTVPGDVVISARRVASAALSFVTVWGDECAELISPLAACVQAKLFALMPNLSTEIASLITLALPKPGGIGPRRALHFPQDEFGRYAYALASGDYAAFVSGQLEQNVVLLPGDTVVVRQ